jgi:hypothetical protein
VLSEPHDTEAPATIPIPADLAAALEAWRVAHLEVEAANRRLQDARDAATEATRRVEEPRRALADAAEAARNARDRVESLIARQMKETP